MLGTRIGVRLKTFILTEKPSVAMDFARGLGIRGKKDGYIENNRYIITWTVGHLVELFEPQDYNPAWKKWFDNSDQILKARVKPSPSSDALKESSEDIKDLGTCPACGGKIIKGKRGYGCSNWKAQDGGCRFVIWEMISGKGLTSANIRTLTGGKTTRKYVFKTQTDGRFRVKLKLEKTQAADGKR